MVDLAKAWLIFRAYWRLSKRAVCQASVGLPIWADYHDYPDSLLNYPLHFHLHTCKRCGKKFTI